MERLVRPHGHDGSTYVVSVSGGKDSTATVLALREAEIPARYVFADTGWEAPQTYEYLVTLERTLGITIDRVEKRGGMVAECGGAARFPSRMQRWCTRELKIIPLRAYHDKIVKETDEDTISVVGVRAQESPARARLAQFELDDDWGGYIWRPLMHWTVEDVLQIHHHHGVPVNPLYRLGYDRVGCLPCVYSRKEDIRLTADHFPDRIELIRALEKHATMVRRAHNLATPGRHGVEQAAFFLSRQKGDPARTIDEVVEWARTDRGGKQLPLIQEDPEGGCFRWGLCDAIPAGGGEGDR